MSRIENFRITQKTVNGNPLGVGPSGRRGADFMLNFIPFCTVLIF